MRQPNRRPEPGSNTAAWVLALIGAAVAALALLLPWASAAAASWWSAGPGPGDPVTYLLGLATGARHWPPGASLVLAVLLLLLLATGAVAAAAAARAGKNRTRIDDRAAALATGADLRPMTTRHAQRDAERLGAAAAGPGVPLGQALRSGHPLYGSWEWVLVVLMGPRAGKTTCLCIRQVLETTGPVVVTSNKRDIVDATRGPRAELGTVWVNDLQQIIGEPPAWWWNPLSYVTGVAEADELAGLFAAANRDATARTDAYFDNAAKTLLSGLLLAAAVGRRPITAVYRWLTDPDNTEPVQLLRDGGHQLPADAVYATLRLTPKQRDGVFGTALQLCAFLRDPTVLPWVTPSGPDDDRPQFDPAQFVQSRQTIYLVSREGRGTARALTAALTVAIVTAAERLAARSRAGRLPTPMTCVLDEAANVCRWPELPDVYSHYGSRGIIIATFLQSWSQGVQVWGAQGMEKLWTAANIRMVGAGIAETDFLERVSKLIGDRDVVSRSSSVNSSLGQGRRTTTAHLRRERILDVAELSALPRGRAVLLTSGQPAALIGLTHWSGTDYADKVRASDAYYGTAASRTGPRPGPASGSGPSSESSPGTSSGTGTAQPQPQP